MAHSAYLIGFCSKPLSRDPEEFAKKDIEEKLFEPYLEGLKNYGQGEYADLFQPVHYQLWGKYDICSIAKVDDLEFATRFFRSYNPMAHHVSPGSAALSEKFDLQNFDYKVAIGTTAIESSARHKEKILPYIAISQLKINSAFLIGNGRNILEPIKKKIESAITSFNADTKVCYKICESHSYHELILILTSNSLYRLKDILLKIRKFSFKEICEDLHPEESASLLKNSLFSAYYPDWDSAIQPTNHIFESTQSTYGTHLNLLKPDKSFNREIVESPILNEVINTYSRWNLKPGHHTEVLNYLESIKNPDEQLKTDMMAGKGDFMLEKRIAIHSETDYTKLCFPDQYFLNNTNLALHVVDTFTSISVDPDNKEDRNLDGQVDQHTHADLHKKLAEFLILSEQISDINKKMRAMLVPKVLSEKVMKIISNYNNAVLNPDMFSSYVELFPYINDKLIPTIKYQYEIRSELYFSAETLYRTLNQICQNIESAFHNRFYQSYWASDIQEFNLDYSGGVHNLISAYDGSFKALSDAFTSNKSSKTFVFVRSDRDVNTGSGDLKMNYLHLIQPLGYCAVVTHECSSFAIEKWFLDQEREQKDNSDWQAFKQKLISLYDLAGIHFPWRDTHEPQPTTNKKLIYRGSDTEKLLRSFSADLNRPDIYLFFNERAFRYFITSEINLRFAFDSNVEAYTESQWNYLLQSGQLYSVADTIEPAAFITISIRFGLLKMAATKKEVFTKQDFDSIYPKYELLKSLRNKYSNDIYLLLSRIWKTDSSLKKWFTDWNSLFSSKSIQLIPSNNSLPHRTKAFKDYFDENSDSLVKLIKSQPLGDYDNAWATYLALIQGYLSHYSGTLTPLKRSISDGTPIPELQELSLVKIDPIGGTFVTGPEARATYFDKRMKFINLLSHYSQVYKKHYISKRLKELESQKANEENSKPTPQKT